MATLVCESCAREFQRELRWVKILKRRGCERQFCSQKCTGIARRLWKSVAQKKREKAAYDEIYRAREVEKIRQNKAAYFRSTYDPEKARRERAKNMSRHVAYCRKYYSDPKRKAAKEAYDLDRRARAYGEYADAYKLLIQLQDEVRKIVPSWYERAKIRGYYDRVIRPNAQQRRRDAQISRW
jgi:hypothetical protein